MGIHNLTSVFLRIINSAEEHWGPGRQDFSSPSFSVIIVKNKASMDLHLKVVSLFSRLGKKLKGIINPECTEVLFTCIFEMLVMEMR